MYKSVGIEDCGLDPSVHFPGAADGQNADQAARDDLL